MWASGVAITINRFLITRSIATRCERLPLNHITDTCIVVSHCLNAICIKYSRELFTSLPRHLKNHLRVKSNNKHNNNSTFE